MTVISSFVYVEDNRIVLAFDTPVNAEAFSKSYSGRAEIFDNKTHVFLQKPKGLTIVRGTLDGQLGFVFNDPKLAQAWAAGLAGNAYIKEGDDLAARSVFVGPSTA
jgi:hypothetical protein